MEYWTKTEPAVGWNHVQSARPDPDQATVAQSASLRASSRVLEELTPEKRKTP